jgi:hypothetical protein
VRRSKVDANAAHVAAPRAATVEGVARPPRLEVPDGIFHTWARGNERRPIYRDDGDFRTFLRLLGPTVARYRRRGSGPVKDLTPSK